MSESARWHYERIMAKAEINTAVASFVKAAYGWTAAERKQALKAIERWHTLRTKDEQSFDSD